MDEDKKPDEIYCPECGKPVKKNAVFCPHCGIQVKELAVSAAPASIKIEPAASPKSKTVSVVLAVFFGFWSWLYTYKKDFIKFWIYIGFPIAVMVIFIIIEAVHSMNNPLLKYSTLPVVHSHLYVGVRMAFANYGTWTWVIFLSSYIWALCNSIIRPESFYKNYPNG